MQGRAHMLIGAAVGMAVASAVPNHWSALWLLPIAAVSAGLADLDSDDAAARAPLGVSWSGIKRTAGRRRRSGAQVLLLLPRVLGALVLDLVARVLPHRGITHWLTTWALLSAAVTGIVVLLGWPPALGLAFSLGYLSHLLADGLTVSGVAYLAPFYSQRIHLLPKGLRFRYDSPLQWLIVLAVYGAVFTVCYPELIALARALLGGSSQ